MNPNNLIYVALFYDGNETRAVSLELEGDPTFGPLGRQEDIEEALMQGLNLDTCDITALITVVPQAGGLIVLPDVIIADVLWEPFDISQEQFRPIYHVRVRQDGLITADMP